MVMSANSSGDISGVTEMVTPYIYTFVAGMTVGLTYSHSAFSLLTAYQFQKGDRTVHPIERRRRFVSLFSSLSKGVVFHASLSAPASLAFSAAMSAFTCAISSGSFASTSARVSA